MFVRTSTPAKGNASVGTVVSYADMANAPRFFTVIATNGNEATVVDLQTGRIDSKTFGQVGWVLAEAAA